MSVQHRVYSRFYSACVNESLNELSYPAKQAGLNYSIREGYEGIYVDVNGYTESSLKLYELMLEHMVAFTITDVQFDALKDKPQTYTTDGTNADTDNEWTFVDGDPAYITHQRSDNSRWKWEYDAGINTGTDADTTGFLGSRESLTSGQ